MMKINKLSTERSREIKDKYNLSNLAATVLASKQCSDAEIEDILREPVLSNPFAAKNVKEVVERIQLARQRHEKVMVCGDYDCDGICATTILVDALQKYGVQTGFYIPDRFKEGYGLNERIVELAHQKGYTLLITVDNGVKAHAALAKAKALSMDVIVSDHHNMEEEVMCDILLHPALMDDRFSTLCGAGVALLVSRALIGNRKEHIVLACVASIGDVMCVLKETRAIIKLGIQYLQEDVMLPIQLLQDRYERWTLQRVAFQVVPKLNVAGRLADCANVNNIVRYLLCNNRLKMDVMVQQINQLNTKRKQLTQHMLKKANKLIQPNDQFQYIMDEDFHEGLNGIVAGKLSEQLKQPVLVASRHLNEYKGSIRSIDGVDLRTFFQEFSGLSAYGGHEKAAGIAFSEDVKDALQDYINDKIKNVTIQSEKVYDVIPVKSKYLNTSEIESLSVLMPFGEGFQEPLFYFENEAVQSAQLLKNEHSKWLLANGVTALKFNSQAAREYLQNPCIHLIGTLEVSKFRGNKSIQMLVKEEFTQ